MVNCPCPNCNEIFNKKSNFNYHINRKRPCVKKITPIAPEITNTICDKQENNLLCVDVKSINKIIEPKEDEMEKVIINGKNNKTFCCKFCNQYISRKFTLDRHVNNNKCKIKLNQEQQKGVSTDNLIQNNDELVEYKNKLIQYDEKYNLILKRLNDLENENNKLKTKIKKQQKTI